MKRSLMATVACFGIAMGMTGCTTLRIMDFSVISSKNVNVPFHKAAQRTVGEDCAWFVPPNMKEALDRAIRNAGPEYDSLVDGVVYQDIRLYFNCYRVEGTPMNTMKLATQQ